MDVNTTAARELGEFVQNDFESYKHLGACFKNLAKHHGKGRFDYDLAVKGVRHVTDPAAKRYHEQYGWPGRRWFDIFTVWDRNVVAEELVQMFQSNIAIGDRWWDDTDSDIEEG